MQSNKPRHLLLHVPNLGVHYLMRDQEELALIHLRDSSFLTLQKASEIVSVDQIETYIQQMYGHTDLSGFMHCFEQDLVIPEKDPSPISSSIFDVLITVNPSLPAQRTRAFFETMLPPFLWDEHQKNPTTPWSLARAADLIALEWSYRYGGVFADIYAKYQQKQVSFDTLFDVVRENPHPEMCLDLGCEGMSQTVQIKSPVLFQCLEKKEESWSWVSKQVLAPGDEVPACGSVVHVKGLGRIRLSPKEYKKVQEIKQHVKM